MPSPYFSKAPKFDSGAPVLTALEGAGSRGRPRSLMRERPQRPGCPALGTGAQLPLQPGFPQPSLPSYRTQAYRATTKRWGSQPLPTGTERGAPRVWNRRGSAGPASPAPRLPGWGSPAPGHGVTAPGSSGAPVLPTPCPQEEEKHPRTHGPRLPGLCSALR